MHINNSIIVRMRIDFYTDILEDIVIIVAKYANLTLIYDINRSIVYNKSDVTWKVCWTDGYLSLTLDRCRTNLDEMRSM